MSSEISNTEALINWLKREGIPFTKLSEDHLFVTERFDVWPSKSMWIERAEQRRDARKRRGLGRLIEVVKGERL